MEQQRFRNSFAENKESLAWLAGFFDGEGCIYFKESRKKVTIKNRDYFSPELQIILGQSGEEGKSVLEAIRNQFSFGKLTSSHGSSLTKQTPYVIRTSGKNAVAFLKSLEPFLVLKKQKAQEVLTFMENYYNGK